MVYVHLVHRPVSLTERITQVYHNYMQIDEECLFQKCRSPRVLSIG